MNPLRAIPSVVPLKSPSPDLVRSNVILPSKSPSRGQVRRCNTPVMTLLQSQSFHSKYQSKFSNERKRVNTTNITAKYQSGQDQYSENGYSQDQILKELKRLLMIINQKEKVSQFRESDEQILGMSVLRDQNQKLKLQKQALLTIINTHNEDNQLKQQNYIIKQKIYQLEYIHKKQLESLESNLRSLTIQIKSMQSANIVLEKQNARLLKLLKQKDDSQRKIYHDMMESKSKMQAQEILKKNINRSQSNRILVIKQYYRDNINNSKQLITNELSQMEYLFMKNNQLLSNRIQSFQNRIQTLHKFLIATLNIKKKSINKVNQSQNNKSIQLQFRKLNSLIQQLHQNKELIQKQTEGSKLQYQKYVSQLEFDLKKYQQSNTKNIKIINQITSQLDKNERDFNSILYKKDNQIQQLKQINFNLKKQFEKQSKFKPQQIQQLLRQKDNQFYDLQINTQTKVRQLINSYQRELQIKNKQISSKNKQLEQKYNLKTTKQSQLESQISMLNYKISDLKNMINEQQEKLRSKEYQIIRLSHSLDQKLNDHHIQINNLNQQIFNIKHLNSAEIQQLKYFLSEKDKQCQNLKQIINTFRRRNITNDLKEIKQMLNSDDITRIEDQLIRTNQNYQRTVMQLQQKNIITEKLTHQKFSLRQRITNLQRDKLFFIQKIGYLQKNQDIYKNQLKERKQFCQDLIQNKALLEKQIITFKKSTQYLATPTIKNILLVAQKIDNLIGLQTEISS